jgi:hypothetical protein
LSCKALTLKFPQANEGQGILHILAGVENIGTQGLISLPFVNEEVPKALVVQVIGRDIPGGQLGSNTNLRWTFDLG